MIPYKMLNKIIKICAQTFPFAAKIKDVIPMHAAIIVMKSIFPVTIFEIMTPFRFLLQFVVYRFHFSKSTEFFKSQIF